MRRFFTTGLIILFGTTVQVAIAQGTWHRVDVPTDHFLRAVHFTDSLHGWAAGNDGVIIHTSDAGNTWELQDSQTVYDIADLTFLNERHGWAVAHNYITSPFGTIILKTYDGGQNWNPEPYPREDTFMNCILFRDSLDIWMGGSPHALVHSTDGGATWQQAMVDTSILAFFPVLSIHFWDDHYGYACGGMFEIAGVTWRTTDGGDTWYAIDPAQAPADEVHELYLYDSVTVIGSGGDPDFGYGVAFIRTWDGGVNWDYEEIGLPGNSYDLDFRTPMEAWAPLGQRQQLIYSLDGGDSWQPVTTPESTSIFDITFPDSLHGWAVGMDGAVLKYRAPFGVSADPVEPEVSGDFSLQCYPNPFTATAVVKFQNPGALVDLTIFDIHGRPARTLLNGMVTGGTNAVAVNAADLSPGIYFCRLTLLDTRNTPFSTQTIKLLLLQH